MSWQPRPVGTRAIAAAISLGATLMLLLTSGQRRATDARPTRQRPVTLTLIPSVRPALVQQAADRPLVAVERPPRALERLVSGRAVSTVAPATTPERAPGDGASTADLALAPIAEAPPAAASAPLILDAATLRAASARSLGLVRKLAAMSGQALPSGDRSSNARLGSAVAEAVKPDCLAPNAQGSLLAIPGIALAAISGKCN